MLRLRRALRYSAGGPPFLAGLRRNNVVSASSQRRGDVIHRPTGVSARLAGGAALDRVCVDATKIHGPDPTVIDAAIAELRRLRALPLTTLRAPRSEIGPSVIPSALAFLAAVATPSVPWAVRTRCARAASEAMALLGLCGVRGVPSQAHVALLVAWGGVTGAPHVVTIAAMRAALELQQPAAHPGAAARAALPGPVPSRGRPALCAWKTPLLVDALLGLAAVLPRLAHPEMWWWYRAPAATSALSHAGPRGAELLDILTGDPQGGGSPALLYDPVAFQSLRGRFTALVCDELALRIAAAEEAVRGAGDSGSAGASGATGSPSNDAVTAALAPFGGVGGIIALCEAAVSQRIPADAKLWTSIASLFLLRPVLRSAVQTMGTDSVDAGDGAGSRNALISCATGKHVWEPLRPFSVQLGVSAGDSALPRTVPARTSDLALLLRMLVASGAGGAAAALSCGVLRFMRSDRPRDLAALRAFRETASPSDVAGIIQAVARLHHLYLTGQRGTALGGSLADPDDGSGAGRAQVDLGDDLNSGSEARLLSTRSEAAAPKQTPGTKAALDSQTAAIADMLFDSSLRTLPRLVDWIIAHITATSGASLALGSSRPVVPLAQVVLPVRVLCHSMGLMQASARCLG